MCAPFRPDGVQAGVVKGLICMLLTPTQLAASMDLLLRLLLLLYF